MIRSVCPETRQRRINSFKKDSRYCRMENDSINLNDVVADSELTYTETEKKLIYAKLTFDGAYCKVD